MSHSPTHPAVPAPARAALLRRNRALLLLLLAALLVRLALWAQPLHEPANDEREYIAVAHDLLAGRGWVFYDSYHWLRAPLYPLFLAGSLWLAGGDLHRAALPNIALSVGVVALVYLLARELGARTRLALLAGGLAATLLTLATFASLYMAETLFSLLLSAALLLLLRWQRTTPPDARGWQGWPLLAAAGLCYGLAALTRSPPLAFLPVLLLWLSLRPAATGPGWQVRWRPALLVAACVALPIAPWTLRTCAAYQECILIETGFSYNMWAFNEPRADPDEIFRALEAIPDPAARAAFATEQGMQRLREDPLILARKLWPNWIYLWRVKPIQDRFLQADYYADPSPLLFLAALLIDDALYVAITALAVLGAAALLPGLGARDPPMRLRAWRVLLPVLWIGYVTAISMVTHGEARYRHFFLTLLIPLAVLGVGWLAGRVRSPAAVRGWHAAVWSLAGLVLVAHLYTVLLFYPWEWAIRGATRSAHRLVGDIALVRGDAAAAEAAYRRAFQAQRTPDIYLALGHVRRAQGDMAGAEGEYRAAWRKERLYVAASATLADFYRTQGRTEEARVAFRGTNVAEQAVLDWSWQHLEPLPAARVDVGSGLDFGYVGGMYPAERLRGSSARWTNGTGWVKLALPAATTPVSGPLLLRARLAAPHPDAAAVPLRVCLTGARICQTITLGRTWQEGTLLLPPTTPRRVTHARDGSLWHVYTLALHSPTFVAPDGRTLGVQVDDIVLLALAPLSP